MAKRQVIECEICWHEIDQEDLFGLSINKGKGLKSRQYEVCKICLVKLEQQLVSNNKLDKNWSFQNKTIIAEPPKENSTSERSDVISSERSEEDNVFAKHKERELAIARSNNEYQQERIVKNGPALIKSKGDECLHPNKSPIMTGVVDGQKMFFQRCKDCGIALKPHNKPKRR